MKLRNPGFTFACGTVLGLMLALSLAAQPKPRTALTNQLVAPPAVAAPAALPMTSGGKWAHVQVLTYPSGTTGFFDTQTGTLYLYDVDLNRCFLMRELTTLGEPLRRL